MLDAGTLDWLEVRRAAYISEREAAGESWAEHDLMFGDREGRPLMPWRIDHYWRALRNGCGVKQIRFHDIRHTSATLAIASGMDVRMLAERLGHADASITLRGYSHVLDGQRCCSAQSLDSLLEVAELTAIHPATGKNAGGFLGTGADEKAT